MEENQEVKRRAYTLEEAAEVLHCTYRSMQRWVTRGWVSSVKVGRRRLIRVEEIDRILQEGLVETGSDDRADQQRQ